jgi:hypothetical protein
LRRLSSSQVGRAPTDPTTIPSVLLSLFFFSFFSFLISHLFLLLLSFVSIPLLIAQMSEEVLAQMVSNGIFKLSPGGDEQLVEVAATGETHFSFLCALIWPFIDSYYASAMVLFSLQPNKKMEVRAPPSTARPSTAATQHPHARRALPFLPPPPASCRSLSDPLAARLLTGAQISLFPPPLTQHPKRPDRSPLFSLLVLSCVGVSFHRAQENQLLQRTQWLATVSAQPNTRHGARESSRHKVHARVDHD